jgi:energy-coupling factor transporter ATP-binding protein EcfA2
MADILRSIYAAFNPAPLKKEQQGLYVDLDSVRGDSSVTDRMKQKILLSDGPSCQVLTGHRGSGKSTELGQLRHALENPARGSDRMFVVQVQADAELDRNDIDFPEVLVAIIRQLAGQLKDRAGISLQPGYFKDRLQRLKELVLTEVEFKDLDLTMGMAKIATTIRNSPDARKKVRAALEPDTDNWLTAANDVIGQALLELKKQHFRGLVIIVDDLDKMITRPHEEAGCSTTEYLFVHRSAQLTAFQCHLVYTVPIELAYSHHESTIKRLYGGDFPVVPMTKIETPPPSGKTYPKGIAKFREMISARLASVGAVEDQLFENNKVRDDLIKLTGGQPTELMTLIREAIVTEGIPIGPKGIKRATQEVMRSYRRQLRADHWPVLEEARLTGQVVRTETNEKPFRELLESRALLLYRNDEEWYGLNPAIENLEPPPPAAAQP